MGVRQYSGIMSVRPFRPYESLRWCEGSSSGSVPSTRTTSSPKTLLDVGVRDPGSEILRLMTLTPSERLNLTSLLSGRTDRNQ